MLRRSIGPLLWLLLCSPAVAGLSVLTYHDVVLDPGQDILAVSRSQFVAHMDYLEKNGYRVMSLQEVAEYYRNKREFPEKSVLLSFDDGLQSYTKFVVPVLRTYGFPSVASVVTGWLDGKQVPPQYHNRLMAWIDLKQVVTDPLVSIASHSNNLHQGLVSNPQGNEAAATVTRRYFSDSKRYESESEFRLRVAGDLKQSVQRLQEQLGIRVQAVAWPYGEYDEILGQEANLLGLTLQFNLDPGPNRIENFPAIKRIMLVRNPSLGDLEAELNYHYPDRGLKGLAYLYLDDFAGLHAEEQEALLSSLLDVLAEDKIQTVVINPLHSQKSTAFFSTPQLTTEVDIVNRLTHQLKTRLGIKDVVIDLPELGKRIQDPEAVVRDLARLAWFSGILLRERDSVLVTGLYKAMLAFRPGLRLGTAKSDSDVSATQFVLQFAEATDKDMQSTANRINNQTLNTYLVYPLRGEPTKGEATDPAAAIERLRALGITKIGLGAGVKDYIHYQRTKHAKRADEETAAVASGER